MPKYRVEALEKFVVRTTYYVEAKSPKAAETTISLFSLVLRYAERVSASSTSAKIAMAKSNISWVSKPSSMSTSGETSRECREPGSIVDSHPLLRRR